MAIEPEKPVTREERLADLFRRMSELQQRCLHHRLQGRGITESYHLACSDLMKDPGKLSPQKASKTFRASYVAEYIRVLEEPFNTGVVQSHIMSREEMIARLTVMARGTNREVMDYYQPIDPETGEEIEYADLRTRIINSRELTGEQASLVSEISITRAGVKVKLHDSRAAMKQLSELQGYDAPAQTEVTLRDRPARPVIPLKDATDVLANLAGETPKGTA